MFNKLKKLFNFIFGYDVIVTYYTGEVEICRAYLSNDCSIRIYSTAFNRQCYLSDSGVVRGIVPGNDNRWSVK